MELENNQKTSMTRRNFLKRGLGLTAVASLGWSTEFVKSNNDNKVETEVVQKIKQFEYAQGENPLTFEEAKNILLPLSAQLYVQSVPTEKTAEEITNNVFIVRGEEKDQKHDQQGNYSVVFPTGEAIASRAIKQLVDDYPRMNLDYKVANRILLDMYYYGALGSITDEKVFLYLNRINGAEILGAPITVNNPLQYQGINQQVQCANEQPAVRFRTTCFHELFHLDIDPPENPLFPGFSVFIFTDIEEFAADYFAANISDRSGLPYTVGYWNEPNDYKNFQSLLYQAGITDKELFMLHKQNNLDLFLTKLAIGASNVEPRNPENIISIRESIYQNLFGDVNDEYHVEPDWKNLKPYFPKVDSAKYLYEQPSTQQSSGEEKFGCISFS